MFSTILLVLSAIYTIVQSGQQPVACSSIVDWSPSVLYGSSNIDKVHDGSYMICGDKVKGWLSIQASIPGGDHNVFAIAPPVGQIGPLPSSTSWELRNHGYGDGLNIDGTIFYQVDLLALSNTTCLGNSGSLPIDSDVLLIYMIDGGSAPRTFEASVAFEYTNLDGSTC